jgi:ubiquinone/menaquinone biosynthesis C-methylase UbiE
MRVVTLGRVAALQRAVAELAAPEPGARILEIGCGTGAVTERLVARGAQVTAFDQSPAMLEQARARLAAAGDRVDLRERTASEIDALPAGAFDAVVASLCLSEMSAGERRFVLAAAHDRLRNGGRIVVGDEVRPAGPARALHALLRAPQVALAWLLAGSLSRPIPDLAGELQEADFALRSEARWLVGSLAVIVGERAT